MRGGKRIYLSVRHYQEPYWKTDHFLDPCFKEYVDKLEGIQKSTARMIWSLEKLRECQELNIIYLEEA